MITKTLTEYFLILNAPGGIIFRQRRVFIRGKKKNENVSLCLDFNPKNGVFIQQKMRKTLILRNILNTKKRAFDLEKKGGGVLSGNIWYVK